MVLLANHLNVKNNKMTNHKKKEEVKEKRLTTKRFKTIIKEL